MIPAAASARGWVRSRSRTGRPAARMQLHRHERTFTSTVGSVWDKLDKASKEQLCWWKQWPKYDWYSLGDTGEAAQDLLGCRSDQASGEGTASANQLWPQQQTHAVRRVGYKGSYLGHRDST